MHAKGKKPTSKGLLDLPAELHVQIITRLDRMQDVLALAQVNHAFADLLHHSSSWVWDRIHECVPEFDPQCYANHWEQFKPSCSRKSGQPSPRWPDGTRILDRDYERKPLKVWRVCPCRHRRHFADPPPVSLPKFLQNLPLKKRLLYVQAKRTLLRNRWTDENERRFRRLKHRRTWHHRAHRAMQHFGL